MGACPRIKCTFLSALVMALLSAALTANGQQPKTVQQPTTDQQKAMAAIKALPECSLAKTNNNCKLIIDRSNPIAPPTVQMYSNQVLTVIVKKPKPYESYFLDYQSGQATLSPDVATSIVQGLLPSLAKAEVIHAQGLEAPTPNPCANLLTQGTTGTPVQVDKECDVKEFVRGYEAKLVSFAKGAVGIYRDLEPCVSPDSHLPALFNGIKDPCGIQQLRNIQEAIDKLLPDEFESSGQIAVISANLKVPFPEEAQELTAYQSIADAAAKDLLGYSQRIADLHDFDNASQECTYVARVTAEEEKNKIRCVIIISNQDDENIYRKMVTRQISYSLNTLNLVSNSQEAVPDPTKKKLLASIVINFADSPSKPSALRWEASAGAFFSTLPVRSYSVAPVFTSGVITDNKISQNILRPTVVPFAAANYRISNDLPWTRWRSAIYWTGAVGVNPNTVSADFASGLSISWRSLMFSPLWHLGHDVRLTQGLQVGESLGAGFKGSLATQTYWTSSFALGVSIRIPSLTGR